MKLANWRTTRPGRWLCTETSPHWVFMAAFFLWTAPVILLVRAIESARDEAWRLLRDMRHAVERARVGDESDTRGVYAVNVLLAGVFWCVVAMIAFWAI